MASDIEDARSVGFVTRRVAGNPGLPRWALCHPDGSVAAAFDADITREEVRRVLAQAGLVLREDDAVARAEPAAERVWAAALSRLLAGPAPGRADGRKPRRPPRVPEHAGHASDRRAPGREAAGSAAGGAGQRAR